MNDLPHLKEWLQLPDTTKINVFKETGRKVGLQDIAAVKVEKNLNVQIKKALFIRACNEDEYNIFVNNLSVRLRNTLHGL